jgi:hypothetical protein
MNWRRLPHPYYGNYGGASNHGENYTLPPIDEMDRAFKKHDISLLLSLTSEEIFESDWELVKNLLKINIFTLKKPIYGKIYWLFCLYIFSAVSLLRRLRKL